ncbi:unnamed protein product [Allacma fusca]|uniref:Uncharacterized protein n=1 Tax=Allacma fusca TaxID=39272 RepID=A0A8J2NTX8_9HEXA|nr:unnamed protein product [Allacma fusca]
MEEDSSRIEDKKNEAVKGIEMLKQLPKGIVVNKISGDYTNEGSEVLITQQGPKGTKTVGHIAKAKTTMPGSVNFNQVLPSTDPSSQGLAFGSIADVEINKGESFSTNSDSKRAMAAMERVSSFLAHIAPNAGLPPAPNPISPVSNESLTDGPQQISGTGQRDTSVFQQGRQTGQGNSQTRETSHLTGENVADTKTSRADVDVNESTPLLTKPEDKSDRGCLACFSNCFSNMCPGISNLFVCCQVNF